MSCKGKINRGIRILLLLVITVFASCGGNDIQVKTAPNTFAELFEEGDIDNISLTIYYLNPFYLTFAPLDVDELIEDYKHRVEVSIIDGDRIGEYADLFDKISNVDLIPVESDSYMNARIYYIFENKKTGKIFDVAMWNSDGSIVVNGVKVEYTDVFSDCIVPFLSEETVEELRAYLSGEWPYD